MQVRFIIISTNQDPSKIRDIVLQGGFPSVFCDRYFDRSKGARGNRGHRNEKGPTGEARRLLAVFLQRRREALRSLFAMWLGEGETRKRTVNCNDAKLHFKGYNVFKTTGR